MTSFAFIVNFEQVLHISLGVFIVDSDQVHPRHDKSQPLFFSVIRLIFSWQHRTLSGTFKFNIFEAISVIPKKSKRPDMVQIRNQ